jgi:hypothetical protein
MVRLYAQPNSCRPRPERGDIALLSGVGICKPHLAHRRVGSAPLVHACANRDSEFSLTNVGCHVTLPRGSCPCNEEDDIENTTEPFARTAWQDIERQRSISSDAGNFCNRSGRSQSFLALRKNHRLSRLLRCTLHFRDGSIVCITAPQHRCPLHPS